MVALQEQSESNMVLDAVVFDLGGTLITTRRNADELLALSCRSLTNCLASQGFDIELKDVIQVTTDIYDTYFSFALSSYIELEAHTIYKAILYRLSIPDYSNKHLLAEAIKSYYKPVAEDYQEFEDAETTLSHLKEKRLKLGLLSNNHSIKLHDLLLERFGLRKFFDAIVVSGQLGIRKPHKRIFLNCLQKLQVGPQDSIYVGDRLVQDVEGAKAAGRKCIHMKRSEDDTIWAKRREERMDHIKPDWTVDSLQEVKRIVMSITNK